MLIYFEKLKTIGKIIPFLYNSLHSLVSFFRQRIVSGRTDPMEDFKKFCSSLPNIICEPFFVKVGANDGITEDPLSDILLANTNWKGLLIEPVPYIFERLRTNFKESRRFIFEQVAIGVTAGEADFYYVDAKAREKISDLPPWYDQLGSFDRSHIIKHLGGMLEPLIIECKVQVSTLSNVFLRNKIRDIHLLQVDTEGYDYAVLRTLDFAKYSPLSIFIEHKHLSTTEKVEIIHLLHKHGYIVNDCGVDYCAIQQKAYKRLKRIARMRRIIDKGRHWSHFFLTGIRRFH